MAPRTISIDEMDGFQIDDDGRLYCRGQSVLLERRITLRGFELILASTAAVGALLAGVHPFGASFGWW
ncbi:MULTISPECIES: hypothetical protein [unclassified Mesorhizobium]|uniref:hypothetical protein n=1 Tax=unclassified Mesorhizobium TaxID=325217 RepID=UPI000FE8F347|nr:MULTISPECIES: hypothetical protein [unclassified Mesorhizobium]RWB94997.1 MAG: hypothetical protein EOQ57_30675 [Mesorhizobium sp.]TGV18288.1 hypothetical protein EN786_33860 [Mesorhizobium sp. M4B.F.Ca.ET.143.01.1.1]TIU22837.1 MAG: hypothetical protein E5W49_05760 [Mesorhizobium sp.]